MLRADSVTILARIPISFALSVGSIALLGVSAFFLNSNLYAVELGLGLWISGLFLIWILADPPPDGRTVAASLSPIYRLAQRARGDICHPLCLIGRVWRKLAE